MEIIVITKERMEEVLPQNIKETDVLSDNAKKVLACLINYQFTHPIARQVGYVAISNPTLAKACRIGNEYCRAAVQELIDHNLILRIAGQRRKKGEDAKASEYTILFENLNKPLKKLSYEELYEQYLKSSRIPSGSTNTNAYTDSESDSKSDSESKSKSITISKTETISKTKTETILDYSSELPF